MTMTSTSKYDTQKRGNPSPGLAVVSIGTLQCAQLLWKQPQPSLTLSEEAQFGMSFRVIVQEWGETLMYSNLLEDSASKYSKN